MSNIQQMIDDLAGPTGEGQQQQDDDLASYLGLGHLKVAPKRGKFEVANDAVVDTANAAAGLVKSGVDLVAPGSAASEAIDGFIKKGEATQSEWKKVNREKLARKQSQATGELEKVGNYLQHVKEDPMEVVAQGVGNFGPFRALSLLGWGAKAASTLSAGLTVGEVRGNILDKVEAMKDSELQEQNTEYAQLRSQGMSEKDAKKEIGTKLIKHLPELAGAAAIGWLGGKYGPEAAMAETSVAKSRLGSAALSTVQEGMEGASEQLATNYAVQKVDPRQKLGEDVLLNAVQEGLPGGVGGFAGHTNHAAPVDQPAGERAAGNQPPGIQPTGRARALVQEAYADVGGAGNAIDRQQNLRAGIAASLAGLDGRDQLLAISHITGGDQALGQRLLEDVQDEELVAKGRAMPLLDDGETGRIDINEAIRYDSGLIQDDQALNTPTSAQVATNVTGQLQQAAQQQPGLNSAQYVPEAPSTVAAQLEYVRQGRKPTAVIGMQEAEAAQQLLADLPHDIVVDQRTGRTAVAVAADPARLEGLHQAVEDMGFEQAMGQFLGYANPTLTSSPQPGMAVIQQTDPTTGAPIHEEAVLPQDADKITRIPGTDLNFTTPEQALAQRAERQAAESASVSPFTDPAAAALPSGPGFHGGAAATPVEAGPLSGVVTPRSQALVDLLNTTRGEGQKLTADSVKEVKPTRNMMKVARAIKFATGTNVVFFDTNEKVNGLSDGKSTIYVKASASVMSVIGHEITHIMEDQHPQLYEAVEEVVLSRMRAGRARQLKAALEQAAAQEGTDNAVAALRSELVAEGIGELAQREEFWQAVVKEIESTGMGKGAKPYDHKGFKRDTITVERISKKTGKKLSPSHRLGEYKTARTWVSDAYASIMHALRRLKQAFVREGFITGARDVQAVTNAFSKAFAQWANTTKGDRDTLAQNVWQEKFDRGVTFNDTGAGNARAAEKSQAIIDGTLPNSAHREALEAMLEAGKKGDREDHARLLVRTILDEEKAGRLKDGAIEFRQKNLQQEIDRHAKDKEAKADPKAHADKVAEKLKETKRFASGLSSKTDLEAASDAAKDSKTRGVGTVIGKLSENGMKTIAESVMRGTDHFIDSGAFTAYKKGEKIQFDRVLSKYDELQQHIADAYEEHGEPDDHGVVRIVMPDVVGDQKASLDLIEQHSEWISGQSLGKMVRPIIPIQKGEMTLAQAYDKVKSILGHDHFIVGIPSNAEAVTPQELAEFVATAKPKEIHILGAAADSKLQPRVDTIVATGVDVKITADASPILSKVTPEQKKGTTRTGSVDKAVRNVEEAVDQLAKHNPEVPREELKAEHEALLERDEAKRKEAQQPKVERAVWPNQPSPEQIAQDKKERDDKYAEIDRQYKDGTAELASDYRLALDLGFDARQADGIRYYLNNADTFHGFDAEDFRAVIRASGGPNDTAIQRIKELGELPRGYISKEDEPAWEKRFYPITKLIADNGGVTTIQRAKRMVDRVRDIEEQLAKAKKADKPELQDKLEDAKRRANSTNKDIAKEAKAVGQKVVKPAAPINSEAPEHTHVGVSDQEFKWIVREFTEAERDQANDGGGVHHLFDKPKPSEIVKLVDKAGVREEKLPGKIVYHRDAGWMTVEEAKALIQQWKDRAAQQYDDDASGKRPKGAKSNNERVVLSLFDLTGKWSQPWEEAGYQVFRFDIQDPSTYEHYNEETGEYEERRVGDVTNFDVEYFNDLWGSFDGLDIHAVLAACPCTDFSVANTGSGKRRADGVMSDGWAAKDADGRTVQSIRLVQITRATVEYFKPNIWAIENPVGRIEALNGLPPARLTFNPYQLGDPYTKKTLLWGRFNADLPVAPVFPSEGSKMHKNYGGKSLKTKNARSETPEGFAYGFFMANNAWDNMAMTLANKYDRLNEVLIAQAVAAGVTEEQIERAVNDPYYIDLDDDLANARIKELLDAAKEGTEAIEESVDQMDADDSTGVRSESQQKIDAAKKADAEAVDGAEGEESTGNNPDYDAFIQMLADKKPLYDKARQQLQQLAKSMGFKRAEIGYFVKKGTDIILDVGNDYGTDKIGIILSRPGEKRVGPLTKAEATKTLTQWLKDAPAKPAKAKAKPVESEVKFGSPEDIEGWDAEPPKRKIAKSDIPKLSRQFPNQLEARSSTQLEQMRDALQEDFVGGKIGYEEFTTRSRDIIYAQIAAKAREDESAVVTEYSEAHPGFTTIPVGTKVMATHGLDYKEPQRATVVGNRHLRIGAKMYMLPEVVFDEKKGPFGDQPRWLTPDNIKEVFAPRKVKLARSNLGKGTEQDRKNSLDDQRISPRLPTGKKATEDAMASDLQPDLDTFKRDPETFRFNIQERLAKYPNFVGLKGTADQKAEAMIAQMQSNLLWLHDHWKPEYRERSRLWYVGGNRIATRWAERFGIEPQTVAAVIAATSPQKDWFQNVSIAERIMEAVINNADHVWDDKMTTVVLTRPWAQKVSSELKYSPMEQLARFKGKSLKSLYDPARPASLLDMAMFIRAWDEAHNPQMARVITPEGDFAPDWDRGKTGKPVQLRAQSFAAMVKTLAILQSSDRAHVSAVIGLNHKVRSFFNNIVSPFDSHDVTIDTHAVAAALLRPLGSSDIEVGQNFGSTLPGEPNTKSSVITGLNGSYALYAEAYRRAAAERGILPREMQSITWEAVRGLFRPEQKTDRIKAEADRLWTEASKGNLNVETLREKLLELVQGIADPAWVGTPAGRNEGTQDSSYRSELPEGVGREDDARGAVESAPAAQPARQQVKLSRSALKARDLQELHARAASGKLRMDLPEAIARNNWGEAMRQAKNPAERAKLRQRIMDKAIGLFADSLVPVKRWIESLPLTNTVKQRLQGQLYTATTKRMALEKEVTDKYQKALFTAINKAARAAKMSTDEIKTWAGEWMTARYAPFANQHLIDKDSRVLLAYQNAESNAKAQLAIERAKVKPSAIRLAQLTNRIAYLGPQIAIAQQNLQDRIDSVNAPMYAPRKRGVAGGMNTAEAAHHLALVEKMIPPALLEEIAKPVYELMEWRKDQDKESGRAGAQIQAAWPNHPWYVPLTGDPRATEYDNDVFDGGNSVNQSKEEALDGRMTSLADNAIDAAQAATIKTINFSAMQGFKKALMRAYMDNQQKKTPDDIGLKIVPVSGITRNNDDVVIYRDTFTDPTTGLEEQRVYGFKFADPAIIKAIKEDNHEQVPRGLRIPAALTRNYGRAVTLFMPMFAPVNLMRDIWERTELLRTRTLFDANGKQINLDHVARRAYGQMINMDIWKATFDKARSNGKSSAMRNLLEEMIRLGGNSTWGDYLARQARDLDAAIRSHDKLMGSTMLHKSLGKVGHLAEVYNNTFEMVAPLAIYVSLKAEGMTAEDAAAATLDLMNFKKKGTTMPFLRALYVFAQPAATSAYNLAQYLSTPKGQARFIAQGVVAFGLYALLKGLSWDDDDDGFGNELDNLPNYVVERSIPIKMGDNVVKVPVGFGPPQLAWATAATANRLLSGRYSFLDALGEVGKSALKMVSPVAPSEMEISSRPADFIVQTFFPTVARPLLQIATDQTPFGAALTPQFKNPNKMKYEQAQRTTAGFWSDVAKNIYDMTGVDMYPDHVKTLASGVLIGPWQLAMQGMVENPAREARGEQTKNILFGQIVDKLNDRQLLNSVYYRVKDDLEKVNRQYESSPAEHGDLAQTAAAFKRFKEAESRLSERRTVLRNALHNGMDEDAYNAQLQRAEEHGDRIRREVLKHYLSRNS